MLMRTGELAGKEKHPYFLVSIPVYCGSCPRPHHVRYGVEDRGNGSSCPAALVINTARTQPGAEAERGQAAAWHKQGKNRSFS